LRSTIFRIRLIFDALTIFRIRLIFGHRGSWGRPGIQSTRCKVLGAARNHIHYCWTSRILGAARHPVYEILNDEGQAATKSATSLSGLFLFSSPIK
jgi:hypothetical protein